ncbi:MAG TPA: microcin ABC transporter ATP-binding protein [Flavobacteriales bacterium]|nr:microcin ABC transporter ATP-binding protein [Flavobacteriales bacterium]
MSDAAILTIDRMSIAFGEAQPVVKEVSCEVFPGQTTCIVGESGSGKTLTSLAVMGLLPGSGALTHGEVRGPEGTVWAKPGWHGGPVGRDVAMVFQDPMSSLNPSMRVGAQVAEPLELHRNTRGEAARAEVARLFDEVGLPQGSERKYSHELSGGQKQRVMIALALACNPRVLLADEPTTALDVTVQRDILDLLQRLRDERGLGVLFVTHDLDVVRDIADHVVVMRHGEVVESGPCQGVMNAPKHPYTQSLLAAMPEVRDASAQTSPAANPAGDAPLVAARGVVKRFVTRTNIWGKPTHTFDALKGVDLAIVRGERVGLVGESGSGKSTLGNILLGLDTWDEGNVTWKGGAPKGATFRRAAQPVFQDPFSALNPSMTVGAALQEAVDAREDKHGPSVAGLLEEVGLSASDATRKPGSFSGGQRQRIVLARALALSPEFLVLDESVAALDLRIQAEILDLLKDLCERRGLTFLFISHDLNVVGAVCDRIAVMREGEIVEEGPATQLLSSPQHPYTQRLLNSRPGAPKRVGVA